MRWFTTDMLARPCYSLWASARCIPGQGCLKEARKVLSVNEVGGGSEVNGQNPLTGTKIFVDDP